ncbi:MAG: hypothetical protein ACJ72N_27690 [Labedaea sp.]
MTLTPARFARRTVVAAFGMAMALLAAVPASGAAPGPAPATPGPVPAPAAPTAAAAPCPGQVCVTFTIEGTSRIAKLASDLVLVPGTFDAVAREASPPDPEWPLRVEGDLKLPSSPGYFLIFRFVPSTNVTTFVQVGKVTGRAKFRFDVPGFNVEVDLVARLNIRLSEVKEDGVALNAGDNCVTGTPAEIPIKGVTNLLPGTKSVVHSTFEIPPFHGCGTAENLDPLFTGLIAGPDNTLDSTLTALPAA